MFGFIKRIFGTSHERMMRKLQPIVVQINSKEDEISALSDEQLRDQTAKFKQQLENGATLDDILPEAFATVREVGKRVLNMRHYDVQLIGGIVLHKGMISEMKTGEGKTLVATCPMYLNALAGKGAHLVTVNDYLASRDADWMGQIYKFLGLSVGKILADLDNTERRDAYNCDITYGTNNEFGFDYLRDNMKYQLSDYVQRGHFYAIVDEVDSILIDEARTPLIISGQLEQDLNLYKEINKIVPFLKRDEDYTVDEKAQSVALNDSGIEKVEKHLNIKNIYDPENFEYLHHINKALQAHTLYKLDQNYVIENGKIVIIDDFTGRMMYGRRWSDGLHQAIEAKEGVEIQAESQTLATITFQNYFRMYDKLAGMTGTADTEAEEFDKIYKLKVVSIPTAKTIIRKDYQDVIYYDEKAKIQAIAKQIKECHEKGQPILVGTVSVEKSEVFSKAITRLGIPHNVLNAKFHKQEAEIIAQAGRKGAVTIATNMAGRGTDILLGGNPEFLAKQDCGGNENDPRYPVLLEKYKEQCAKEKEEVYAAGGLFILGTERHESRRIDNQLRGRAGRQGDPGASRFFLSLDDDLIRIFGGEEMKNRMTMLGMHKQADIPIESGLVTRSIETAQKRVEGRNFDIRKNLLEYDDVMNAQRKTIYELRHNILAGIDVENEVLDAFEAVIYGLADKFMPPELAYEDWQMDGMLETLESIFGYKFIIDVSTIGRGDRNAQLKAIWSKVEEHYNKQKQKFDNLVQAFEINLGDDSPYKGKTGTDLLLELAQNYYLREIDYFWRAHLTAMTGLRESISLRGYAQKDPKQEYKREAYTLFERMMMNIKQRMMTQVCRIQIEKPDFSRMKSNRSQQQVKPEPRERLKLDKSSAASPVSQEPNQSKAPRKAMSMAELMPVSIAEAAAKQREPKTEKPKGPMSMADLMPASMRQAMEETNAANQRRLARLMQEAARMESEESEPETDLSDAETEEKHPDDQTEAAEVKDEKRVEEQVARQRVEEEEKRERERIEKASEDHQEEKLEQQRQMLELLSTNTADKESDKFDIERPEDHMSVFNQIDARNQDLKRKLDEKLQSIHDKSSSLNQDAQIELGEKTLSSDKSDDIKETAEEKKDAFAQLLSADKSENAENADKSENAENADKHENAENADKHENAEEKKDAFAQLLSADKSENAKTSEENNALNEILESSKKDLDDLNDFIDKQSKDQSSDDDDPFGIFSSLGIK